MSNLLPKRKNHHLPISVYNYTGLFFITICTCNKSPLFGQIVNDKLFPSPYGLITIQVIEKYKTYYMGLDIRQYVVMPNHVHLLIFQQQTGNNSISLHDFIRRLKGQASKGCGISLWQRGYYDHVIRTENDMYMVMEYIQNNPRKWILDKEYIKK